jgi:hypothetical protein
MSDSPSTPLDLVDDIARWRQVVPSRAPSYHRLLQEVVSLLEDGTREGAELAKRIDDAWAQRTFHIFYERPLLLIAALRLRALSAGATHPLWPALAAPEPDPRSITRSALLEALADDAVFVCLRSNFVQTNETSRALAWLWPAQLIGCDDGARPLVLVEVGASAGLNLTADRLPSPWTNQSGARVPSVRAPALPVRIGIDAYPLDVCSDRDANWLRACVWPGEHDRIARLEVAIAAFRAAPAQLERGDVTVAPNVLRAACATRHERTVVLAFQTIVRDYLEPDKRARYEREMRRWIADSAVASTVWVEIELENAEPDKPLPIVAHVRDATGVVDIVLGTTGYHPAVVVVDDAAVERFARLFR